jgi:hypothetical protein
VHSRLAELLDYAEAQRAALLAALEAVPEPLWTRRPDPEAWSVAEVLEHLHRVEAGVARLLRRRLVEARAAGLGAETDAESLLGSLDRFGLVERRRRVTAPEPVRPRGELPAAEAVSALASSRHDLRDAAAAGNGLALGTVHASHALLGPLTLYQWILFVGQHEARHAAQIRDIARRLAPALTLE